ncbi:peptidylprolyl isomerase [Phaeobacter gallaeciensis]|uniref:Parvulin-like PPIase n=1 Tax=Phaeobacter gallaeciensis TaxID=60890 RepID=A0AAD0ECZ1_9RHOB|nr:peptidylprolyl isomerase [Phaeobacter gallaeciensis]AHD11240.1 Parvulin-like peptidyl-prolyl isomerase [Phaeobacter gallaeciensis DSM 26640]ATE94503.1 putative peptidylprolyl isomerase [Phaeobacter gallaeciensis]ATE98776.1 putative peptidylprolyl isomerase [Phaeobacter gallaeciensis]ATF03167.1 putative peptidylprolyl isomerase [Phaeobacter gallaeciensis]ATF07547.1 putative peptidylprolyl isomerase [Phaeobacter gallaeciensis]
MRKGLTYLSGLALAAALTLPMSATAEPHANTVVATVNGEEITIGHMIIARATLPQQYQQLPDDVLYDAILDQLIQQTSLKQELNGEVPKYVALSLENEARSLLAADVIEKVMENAASDEDLRAAYDEKYTDGTGGDEFNASHILVETEEDAAEVRAELDAGADFATLARERSTGPSGPNGGELGWFGKGRMVPEFEEAVLVMGAGDVSAPVQTQFGWHVIKLNDRRTSAAPTFDEVREELATQMRQDAVEDRVLSLTTAATIKRPEIEDLDPSILKNLDLVRN